MKIHEYQATELFKKAGLPVTKGRVVKEVYEAVLVAEEVGYPVVVKAQVLVGGRGKAGGVKVVGDKAELEKVFQEIKGLTIKGYPVENILVNKAIDIKREYYLSVIVDPAHNDVVLIASAEGGVEIEETAKTNPDAIKKFYLEGKTEIDESRWKDFIGTVFSDMDQQQQGTEIAKSLVQLFFEHDCSIAEINPLAVDGEGKFWAADAKVLLDDNALMRHPELEELRDRQYEDADELEAKEKNLSFVKLQGNVGCIVNGAGLAMATMDIVNICGGKPANFLDVGGSSNPEKVLNALKIILRNKEVKAILINIFGGITRCDDIAKGILEAKKQIEMPVPLVVRLTGTNEKEAKDLLAENGIETYSTMREAVNKAVELANSSTVKG